MKMMKRFYAAAVAAAFLSSAGVAAAQTDSTTTTTTTTSWSPDYGAQLNQYYATNGYAPITDPNVQVLVGAPLPPSVTFYPLPPTIRVPDADRYSYTVINRHPVVVDRTTRRVIHTWD
jgi:ABC-type nitrate/sulfonate/bicarbonate transport system substrate-binding protein